MNLPIEIQVLKIVTKTLEELSIPYMLSGSVAGSFYAQPRMTRDIDFELWVVSPEDLIISKLFWSKDSRSELQLNDVSSIIKFQGDRLDFDYIVYWVSELGVEQLWEEINNE